MRRRTPRAVKREREAARASPEGQGGLSASPAVNCYLIALAHSSVCDESTKELSLFQLVISAKHVLSEFGLIAPYAPVFLLESTSVGFDVEVRSVWVPYALNAPDEHEEATRISIQASRTYLRKPSCRLPTAPGIYDLMLEWRSVGGTWLRSAARFPVAFEERM